MARMEELGVIERDHWDVATVDAIMRTDLPTARPDWSLRAAITAIDTADADRLAVVDADGMFVGVVTTTEILKLEELLEQADDDG